jgi:Iap family predicted aminopeptidase
VKIKKKVKNFKRKNVSNLIASRVVVKYNCKDELFLRFFLMYISSVENKIIKKKIENK